MQIIRFSINPGHVWFHLPNSRMVHSYLCPFEPLAPNLSQCPWRDFRMTLANTVRRFIILMWRGQVLKHFKTKPMGWRLSTNLIYLNSSPLVCLIKGRLCGESHISMVSNVHSTTSLKLFFINYFLVSPLRTLNRCYNLADLYGIIW